MRVNSSCVPGPENLFDIAGVYPLKMKVTGVLAVSHSADDTAVITLPRDTRSATLLLVFVLSLRLRQGEIDTVFRIGCSSLTVVRAGCRGTDYCSSERWTLRRLVVAGASQQQRAGAASHSAQNVSVATIWATDNALV